MALKSWARAIVPRYLRFQTEATHHPATFLLLLFLLLLLFFNFHFPCFEFSVVSDFPGVFPSNQTHPQVIIRFWEVCSYVWGFGIRNFERHCVVLGFWKWFWCFCREVRMLTCITRSKQLSDESLKQTEEANASNTPGTKQQSIKALTCQVIWRECVG